MPITTADSIVYLRLSGDRICRHRLSTPGLDAVELLAKARNGCKQSQLKLTAELNAQRLCEGLAPVHASGINWRESTADRT